MSRGSDASSSSSLLLLSLPARADAVAAGVDGAVLVADFNVNAAADGYRNFLIIQNYFAVSLHKKPMLIAQIMRLVRDFLSGPDSYFFYADIGKARFVNRKLG